MTQIAQQPGQQNGQQSGQVRKFEENAVGTVLSKIEYFQKNGSLQLPNNYSPENAVRSAWLMIQQIQDMNKRPAIEVCTKESIANALLDMVLQGLSPVEKQCYFIVMGNKLTMMRSYFGTIAISKRVAGVKEAIGIPIYADDVFKYTIDLKTGIKTVTQHDQEFGNIDVAKLKGAYAIITYEDGRIEYDIMTMAQITASWNMGNARGNSPAHKAFPDQMACRTVINRALKIPVNSSSDNDLFEENTGIRGAQIQENVMLEIKEHANGADGADAIGFGEDEPTATDQQESEPQVSRETKEELKPGKQIKADF